MSVFNYLVNNAEIVTIATEGYYVELEKKDNDINENYLLEKLLVHIENAIERTEGNKRFKYSRYNNTRELIVS